MHEKAKKPTKFNHKKKEQKEQHDNTIKIKVESVESEELKIMEVELKVPKKYQKYFGKLEAEGGLIDDCKYMLYFADGYAYMGEYPTLPVRSKKEALYFLRQGEPERGYEELKKKGLV